MSCSKLKLIRFKYRPNAMIVNRNSSSTSCLDRRAVSTESAWWVGSIRKVRCRTIGTLNLPIHHTRLVLSVEWLLKTKSILKLTSRPSTATFNLTQRSSSRTRSRECRDCINKAMTMKALSGRKRKNLTPSLVHRIPRITKMVTQIWVKMEWEMSLTWKI